MSDFDEKLIERLKRLEREVERLQVKERPTGSGVTDHGALTGLTDDDHTQYVKDAGTVTDNAITRYNGTDGRTIQNSAAVIDDNGGITAGAGTGGEVQAGIDSNGAVRIGKPNGSSGRTPYIDFYGNGTSYIDARIIASLGGASANYGGNLTLAAANIIISGILQDNNSVKYLLTPSAVTSTPTPTASSGTFTTVSAGCRTTTFGKIRVYSGQVYINDKGTAAGTLRVPIPTGTPQSLSGGYWNGSGRSTVGKICDVFLNPSNSYIEILLYDGLTAIASTTGISFTLVYEIQ